MNIYRYNVTNPDGRTLSIVAKNAKQAREKAWPRFFGNAAFMHYGPSSLTVEKQEKVNGPALIEVRQSFPEYLKGG